MIPMPEHLGASESSTRIEALRRMVATRPDDPRAHFGLALEYERAHRWPEVTESLQRYLELAQDEGNAFGRLGHALRQLGRDEEARSAYERGIETAFRHGHPTMAQEFQEILDEWD
jgi:Flp pilus assembly protein TadD